MECWLLVGLILPLLQPTDDGIALLKDYAVARRHLETEERLVQRQSTSPGPYGYGVQTSTQVDHVYRDKDIVLRMTLYIRPVESVVEADDLEETDLKPLKEEALNCSRSGSIPGHFSAVTGRLQQGFEPKPETIRELQEAFERCLESHLSERFVFGLMELTPSAEWSPWRGSQ